MHQMYILANNSILLILSCKNHKHSVIPSTKLGHLMWAMSLSKLIKGCDRKKAQAKAGCALNFFPADSLLANFYSALL